jgi:hypothetical protein
MLSALPVELGTWRNVSRFSRPLLLLSMRQQQLPWEHKLVAARPWRGLMFELIAQGRPRLNICLDHTATPPERIEPMGINLPFTD